MASAKRLVEEFEEQRRHLRAVAYRLLGSVSEAEDAVQESWIRLQRTDAEELANLGGWLGAQAVLEQAERFSRGSPARWCW